MTPCAGGQLADIDHVVILMQENRSFDHYFGTFKGVRGFDDRPLPGGAQAFAQRYPAGTQTPFSNPLLPFHIDTAVSAVPHQGDCTNDIEHQWAAQHDTWNGGACDNWMGSHLLTDPTPSQAGITMGYYTRADIPFYYALADHFTTCDAYHSSLIGGTDANRLYSLTGTMDPDGWDGGCQFLDTKIGTIQNPGADLGTGGKWLPYPEVLTNAGVSWKAYGTPDGASGDNVLRYFPQFRPVGGDAALAAAAFGSQAFPADFLADCAAGSLPSVSWLFPTLVDSEHAPTPITWGESIVHTVLSGIVTSGLWAKTALFIMYDENGGFFDHVRPPTPPANTPGEYLNRAAMSALAKTQATTKDGRDTSAEPIGLGFRVPMLVVSPFTRNPNPAGPPLVCSDLFDHTSVLRFLETWTAARGTPARLPDRDEQAKRPGLSAWRRRVVGDLTSAFNFAAAPDASVPNDLVQMVPNRADPRVLSECIITLTPASEVPQTAPVVPDPTIPSEATLPTQESAPGRAVRPSGICTPAPAASSPTVSPASNATPALPATGDGTRNLRTAAAVAALGGALWIRRRDAGAGEDDTPARVG